MCSEVCLLRDSKSNEVNIEDGSSQGSGYLLYSWLFSNKTFYLHMNTFLEYFISGEQPSKHTRKEPRKPLPSFPLLAWYLAAVETPARLSECTWGWRCLSPQLLPCTAGSCISAVFIPMPSPWWSHDCCANGFVSKWGVLHVVNQRKVSLLIAFPSDVELVQLSLNSA